MSFVSLEFPGQQYPSAFRGSQKVDLNIKMAVRTLRYLSISIFMLQCNCQPVFDCPKPIAYGDSANLTCSNLEQKKTANINKPATQQVASCVKGLCTSFDKRINFTAVNDDMMLLTVHEANEGDDGKWYCQSGQSEPGVCSLNIYKTPTCEISSTRTTNDLSLGLDLPLNISLSAFYCTNNITWNLQIGGITQDVTEFLEPEIINKISSRDVTYETIMTSSLAGRLELTFNCNDETYEISCSGVKELQLRDPPNCVLTSDDNTEDLTIGNNLTLEAEIEEYPCTTNIEYSLLSGSLMVAEFVRSGSLFYATFNLKPVYLGKQLNLKYTCNNVSATTRTQGVTILLTEDSNYLPQGNLGLLIGLPVAVIVIVVVIGTLIYCFIKRKNTPRNKEDLTYSDVRDAVPRRKSSLKVTTNDTYTEVSDVTGSLKRHHFEANNANGGLKKGNMEAGDVTGGLKTDHLDTSRPRSECIMVPNVAYESVDAIRQRKAEQKGKLVNGVEKDNAKLDESRSQENGKQEGLVSAHV